MSRYLGHYASSPTPSITAGAAMSWELLKRFLESDVFNQNPFLSVAYLS